MSLTLALFIAAPIAFLMVVCAFAGRPVQAELDEIQAEQEDAK